MQKMNIKLPTPTQFDGRHPQFYEWVGEVKAYLSIHTVDIEDIMDDSTKSVTAIVLGDIQTDYTSEDTRNGKFQVAPQEEKDNYETCLLHGTRDIRRDDIVNFRH
eukprot:582309-Amphidinium_carterae.1